MLILLEKGNLNMGLYEKGKDGSHLCNCYLYSRKNELAQVLFEMNNETQSISAFLNGYAIVPIEDYADLVEAASVSNAELKPITFSMENINTAYKELYKK